MDLTRRLSPFALLLVSALCLVGCATSPNLTSTLEDDEIYLAQGEEYTSDAQYLQNAYESSSESIDNYSGWSIPSGISCGMGYGCGNMGYYGGYNNSFGNGWHNGWGNNWNNGWGNPYYNGSNFYGYDPFSGGYMCYGGYNPYGYSPFGWNNNGWGGGWNNGWNNGWNTGWGGGTDVYTSSSVIIKPRTPLTTNVITNSNYIGQRLETNRSQARETNTSTQARQEVKSRNSSWNNNSGWNNSNSNWNNNNSSRSNSRSNSGWGGSNQPSNNNRTNMGSSRSSSRSSSTRTKSSGDRSSSRSSGGRR